MNAKNVIEQAERLVAPMSQVSGPHKAGHGQHGDSP